MNYAPGSNPDPNATGPSSSDPAAAPGAPGTGYVPVPPFPPVPNPSLAASVLLGFIPGVGAMYNGQYAKALAHVVIFVMLVSLANDVNGVFGILVAAWIGFMVFDSYHTARARRDGTPLPNAFGLNDVGQWFQGQRGARYSGGAYYDGRQQPPFASSFTSTPPPPPAPGYGSYYAPPIPPMPPMPPIPPYAAVPVDPAAVGQSCSSRGPTGAIILISLGVLFLLSTFGVLSGRWLANSWPLIIIGLGIFMIFRRIGPRGPNPRGPNQGGM